MTTRGFFGKRRSGPAGRVPPGQYLTDDFPVLSAANNYISGTVIVGTLNSRPSTTYLIDFYSNILPNPLGSGEGQTYLGATTLNTDGTGNGSFSVSFPVEIGIVGASARTPPERGGRGSSRTQEICVTS